VVAERRGPALLRRRLTAQGLAGPPLGTWADGPLAVARRLLAIQAQDPRGFRLAIRARSRGTSGADVDRALTEERSLLVTWPNRGTPEAKARLADRVHQMGSRSRPCRSGASWIEA
jgi:hypothetical protein